MIPSTDPQVRGGLGLGTRQGVRVRARRARPPACYPLGVWVACLQGHSVRERWCFGAPPRWAPRPRPRKPPSLVALCRCFFPFSSGLWRPPTKNPMRPVWALPLRSGPSPGVTAHPRSQTLGTGRIQLQIQIQQSPRAPFHGYVHARLGLLRHPLAGPLQQLVSDRHSKIRPYPEDGAHNR